jgi:serine protease SohB
MEHLAEYGLFFAKFMTVILVLVIVAGGMFVMIFRSRAGLDGHLNITNLNNKFETMNLMLKSQILTKKDFKKAVKEHKAAQSKKSKSTDSGQKRKHLFVIDFKGDIRATEVTSLREEITAILMVASADDEVLVTLESTGGTIHGYGLAASQLKRIRDKGVQLTIAVDKVAASGGYMMACVAHRIIAAPFAIIGSVGVIAQMPNFNRLLKKHDIDFEEITAGEYKRTLTLFGENTEKDREKMREELAEAHKLFKDFIHENRNQVDVDKIATGEYWYGKRALELKLIDALRTSDDYLSSSADTADMYEIDYVRKKPMAEKIFSFGTRFMDHFS